jgi:hypothetical protein
MNCQVSVCEAFHHSPLFTGAASSERPATGRWQSNQRHAISTLDARPELGINLQDVLLNPQAEHLVQGQEDFPAKTFLLVALLEVLEK